MFNLDDFTKTVFEDIRDGVPIIGPDYSSHLDFVSAANEPVDHQHFQSSNLPTPTPGTSSFDMMLVPNGDEHPFWDVTAHPHVTHPRAAFSSNYMAPNDVSVPPPPTARRERRMNGGMDTVERISFSNPQAVAIGFPGTHEYTGGNTLRTNTTSTRTSDYEENFPVVGPVPVAERLSAQGLRPMMTSRAAQQWHPTQMPFVAAKYGSPLASVPLRALPSSAASVTFTQFNPVPDMTTEYGLDLFSQSSWIGEPFNPGPLQAQSWETSQQAPWHPAQSHLDEMSFQAAGSSSFPSSVMPWPFGAAGESAFPSGPTPSFSTGYGDDLSFVSVAEQPFGQGLAMPTQAPQTSETYPQPLPYPIIESASDVAPQASSSSSSAPEPSNAAPTMGKNSQTPYLLAKVKCHLCEKGFNRGSELHDHWMTNKHRLRKLQAENPGVVVTVADLIPNCFCPSCGKGYTTPYIVTRHLKTCRGRI
ncbi:hypothetical protein HETIRDRAFT_321079 [Heterobasidion irregulare TC 32-1]|uniref:C2H2-type domain-containing protein n=1 Tax=Heterobasidion irregulare (strain TC 32-1) TaxID=747525 RepID=W4K5F1_HETIT|nr:uncharacterized protein HETIRDRAFT_321079 [Heterobasidion irregulare TC 32-1]ETW80266.1 hypothetical protein HETIRDRAFT_321079 [Heterobasidion irregulare TC 32-1]